MISLDHKNTNKCTPSPGLYDSHKITAMNSSARYTVAHFKSNGATVIHPDKGHNKRDLIDT